MALAFSILQAPFRFGLSEGVDPRQVPPGTLTTAENVVWRQSGRVEKRPGTSVLPTTILSGGSVTAARRIFTRGPELCVVDGNNLHAYSPTLSKWRTVGKVPDVGMTWTTASDPTSGMIAYDSAVSSTGLRVDAWQSGAALSNGDLFAQVIDTATGATVMATTRVRASAASNVDRVRVMIIGTTAIILTSDNAITAVVAYSINLATLALSSPTTLRSDVHQTAGVNYRWDACVVGNNFVLAYTNSATTIKLYSYNTAFSQQATGGITSEIIGADHIAIDGVDGETLFIAYKRIGTTNVFFAAAGSNLVQTVAPVALWTTGSDALGICRYNVSTCVVAGTTTLTGAVGATTVRVSSSGTVDTTSARTTTDACILTRPFMFDGRCWLFLTCGQVSANTPQTSCLVEVEVSSTSITNVPHRLVGAVDLLIGGDVRFVGSPVPSASLVSATEISTVVSFQSALRPAALDKKHYGLRAVTITASTSMPSDMWRSEAYGQEGFMAGGSLTSYDGRAVFDYGLPTLSEISCSATNGGYGMAAGDYLYSIVDEYRSSSGLLYRGPATAPTSVTTSGGASKVDVAIRNPGIGTKQTTTTLFGTDAANPTLHALYRTVANGTVLQRVTVEPDTDSTIYLDQTDSVMPYADEDSDATRSLASRPAIYTAGGILDDYAPPACVTMFGHADRLFVLAGDQKTWWYSKSFQDDLGVAPGFHPNFRIVFDEEQIAGKSLDDKCIFFSATGISYMLGLGPAPNGTASDFSTPTRIQVDTGCSNPRSIVSTPDGIMYVNERGICLLTRGLEVVQIGKPVQTTLASFPHVTSAVLVPEQSQVRFTCNNSATSPTAGVTLVYDYVEKQWSTFRHTATGYGYGCPYADACLYSGEWTFVTPNGYAYQESSSTYLDGSTYVPMTIETAWISASGPMSFVSVRNFSMHGQSQTDHDLTVSVGFDSASSYDQTATFAAQSAVTTVGPEEFTLTIGTRRKCNTIRFKVVDSTPTTGTVGTGRGPTWDMMALEVGVKTGTGNTPATRRA